MGMGSAGPGMVRFSTRAIGALCLGASRIRLSRAARFSATDFCADGSTPAAIAALNAAWTCGSRGIADSRGLNFYESTRSLRLNLRSEQHLSRLGIDHIGSRRPAIVSSLVI